MNARMVTLEISSQKLIEFLSSLALPVLAITAIFVASLSMSTTPNLTLEDQRLLAPLVLIIPFVVAFLTGRMTAHLSVIFVSALSLLAFQAFPMLIAPEGAKISGWWSIDLSYYAVPHIAAILISSFIWGFGVVVGRLSLRSHASHY